MTKRIEHSRRHGPFDTRHRSRSVPVVRTASESADSLVEAAVQTWEDEGGPALEEAATTYELGARANGRVAP